jgi:hypothetical protein
MVAVIRRNPFMAAPRIDIESVREVRNATNAGERLHEDDTASSSFIHPISRHDFRQVQNRGKGESLHAW